MPHEVTRENWYLMPVLAVDRLREAAGAATPQSFEEQTLIEAARIQEMMTAMNVTNPGARPELSSHLLAVSVRDPLQVSDELVELAGAIADAYRRWYRQLGTAS